MTEIETIEIIANKTLLAEIVPIETKSKLINQQYCNRNLIN